LNHPSDRGSTEAKDNEVEKYGLRNVFYMLQFRAQTHYSCCCFVAVVITKKEGRSSSGDFNDLLARIEGDLRRKRIYTTAKKASS